MWEFRVVEIFFGNVFPWLPRYANLTEYLTKRTEQSENHEVQTFLAKSWRANWWVIEMKGLCPSKFSYLDGSCFGDWMPSSLETHSMLYVSLMEDLAGNIHDKPWSVLKHTFAKGPTSYTGNFFHIWRLCGLPNTCAPNTVSQPFRVEKKSRIVTFSWKCRTGKPKGRPRQISRVILPGWNLFQPFILTMYGSEILHHGVGSLFVYSMPICWVVPPPSNSHHQDYYIFSRGSQPKPSFATGILAGGTTQPIWLSRGVF